MKVSIVIVHYKVKEELFRCLRSIYSLEKTKSFEVIVVDNDEEKTIEQELKRKFPAVRYVASEQNIGFGAGNNLGAKIAKGQLLMFLNPDTEVLPGSIDTLVKFLDGTQNAGVVAPLLLYRNKKPFELQGSRELTPLTAIFSLSFINKLLPNNLFSKSYYLREWNKKDIKEVDVVPGTAFVIRKSILEKIGGFDEKFFLFFEEDDVCKRVRKLGYKIYINPDAMIVHAWGVSTAKSKQDLKKIFHVSRYYYFRKHYGLVSAILVSIFLKMRKEHLLLLSIFSLAAFLRFYLIEENLFFSAEVGDNLLTLKNAFEQKQIPLLGPPTSHPWLSFGPLFYWVYGPVLYFSGFDPLSHGYFAAFVSLLIVLANYVVIKMILNTRVALFSSFLIAISPLFLGFARGARFFSVIPLLVYPFLFFLYKISLGKKKYIFPLGLIYGCMFSFHFTPLVLIPFAMSVLFVKKIKFSLKEIRSFISGFLIPMTPFFLYDATHGLMMTKNVLLWIPYRIAGFLGLYPKNTLTTSVIHENVLSLFGFLTKSFSPYQSDIIALLFLSILIGLVLFIVKNYKKQQHKVYPYLFISLWFFWGYLAIFIHGSPPMHYFVPLLSAPIILFSCFIAGFWDKTMYRIFFLGLFGLFIIINFQYYFSSQWLFKKESYTLVQQVAKVIIKDAAGHKFVLHRVGQYDEEKGDYAQNYQYLLWWYGNEPVKRAKLVYTIYEDEQKYKPLIKKGEERMRISNITIVKRKL